jgi:hypothetical protein
MGEYIKHKGEIIKLGTCEDLYYVRYADLLEMVRSGEAEALGGNLAPIAYLGGAFRFRFPFPDEDGKPERYHPNGYHRGALVPWPEGVVLDPEHLPVHVKIAAHDEDFYGRVGANLPCPLTDPTPAIYLQPPDPLLQIIQQRPFEGALWTVVRCPYCKAAWRLPPDEGEFLAQSIDDNGGLMLYGLDAPELAARIRAGYALDVAADVAALTQEGNRWAD